MDLTVDIMYYLIQTNLVNIVIIVFLYLFLLTNTTLNKRKNTIFLIGAVCVTILIFADAADFYLAQFSYPTVWRYLTSATGYSFRAGTIMFMLFVSDKLYGRRSRVLWILFVLNAVCAYSSVFTKLMFYFDEQNEFHRGPLGIMPFAVSTFYLIILIICSVNMYRLGNKKEASVIFLIAFMACVGVIMETGFKFKFILNGIGGISIVFYYLFLNTQTYKRDALTGALNRHAFYLDTEQLSKQEMIIVSMDLNNLKKINDIQGHDMGDRAIMTVSDAVFGRVPMSYPFYRMGGDEFVILCPNGEMESVRHLMNQICSEIQEKGYQIACGFAEYKPGMNFEQQLRISDEEMYENKTKLKISN